MKKTICLALLLGATGILSVAKPVQAQNGTATGSFHIIHSPDDGTFGDFNVTIVKTGLNYTLNVTPTGGNINDAQNIAATFLNGSTKQEIASAFGGTTASYQVIYSGNKVTPGLGTTVTFSQQDPAAYFSSSPFNGNVSLVAGSVTNKIRITLSDGGSQTQDLVFTPEATSLAMLLPGLIPVGLAVRRRRANRV